jgi:hypothetical protein
MGKSRKLRKSSTKLSKKSSTKHNKNKKRNKHTKHKQIGGMLESDGLPEATSLALFRITNEHIENFRRQISVPMDCFINALQFIGILDPMCANIMRVSTLGDSGFTRAQIEIIFSFFYKTNFHFKSTDDFEVWYNWIVSNITPGHVVFAGYPGHVFLIASDTNGVLLYIDPQSEHPVQDLSEDAVQQYIREKGLYYALYTSTTQLTREQQRLVLAYSQHLSRQAYEQRVQQPVQQPMLLDQDD